MNLAVLGATGATGHHLVLQALDRGHHVTAIARNTSELDLAPHERLRPVAADVGDLDSILAALQGADAVLSGLGVTKGSPHGVLTAGARAVVAAAPVRTIWLGAFGTGPSAAVAGPLTRLILRLALKAELPDKVTADGTVLASGGTVVHAGPLTNRPQREHRVVSLAELKPLLLALPISRATVAAAMLDETEDGLHPGQVVVPLVA